MFFEFPKLTLVLFFPVSSKASIWEDKLLNDIDAPPVLMKVFLQHKKVSSLFRFLFLEMVKEEKYTVNLHLNKCP